MHENLFNCLSGYTIGYTVVEDWIFSTCQIGFLISALGMVTPCASLHATEGILCRWVWLHYKKYFFKPGLCNRAEMTLKFSSKSCDGNPFIMNTFKSSVGQKMIYIQTSFTLPLED